jgi:hypothetical protein
MRTNMFQRVEDWFEQRKSFRAAALVALRKREGLPSPVDENGTSLETRFDDFGVVTYHDSEGRKVERVLFQGAGKDGKPGSFATGTKQQPSETVIDEKGVPRSVPTAGVAAAWGGSHDFEILDIAEDGRLLSDELADLNRDSTSYEISERVSHGDASQQAPGLVLDGTSDAEVDEKLQEYLKRGP